MTALLTEHVVAWALLLTVFRKTQMREDRQVERARRALARCIDEGHTVDEEE